MKIVYQPVYELSSETIVGYEALSRFDDGQTPDEAFCKAWSNGTGVELEVKAFDMAIKHFPQEMNEAYLAINSSARTIIATRGKMIKQTDLEIPSPKIVVELSEKHEISNYLQLDQPIQVLRSNNARIALDDIGAPGYSGFGVVVQIEPDIMKIDRSLISNINENPIKRSIVRGIITTARGLRATVVAEGIETQSELDWCTSLGVDCGQGYFLGMPKPFPEQEENSSSKN